MLKRFPPLNEILPVYAVVAAMAYGWNIFHFLWKVPSWLLFLSLGEILSLLSYALTAALSESFLILAALLLAAFLLPETVLKRDFIVRATWLVVVAYGGIMLLLSLDASYGSWTRRYWNLFSALFFILAILTAYASKSVAFLRSIALWLSDRLIVFLFILIPVSMISILAVIYRNHF